MPQLAHPHAKVNYKPLEAAIRWSGLVKLESQILNSLGQRHISNAADFAEWPVLRLNVERIYDAILNKDLPYGRLGVTVSGDTEVASDELTIRHTDLKAWMTHYYPDQKPSFLFDAIERRWHTAISIDTVQTLLADRTALKIRLSDFSQAYKTLRDEYAVLQQEHTQLASQLAADLSPRGERTYLNIVGALVSLLFMRTPAGHAYSVFQSQESLINALKAHFGDRQGITERTLEAKFAAGRRSINAQ